MLLPEARLEEFVALADRDGDEILSEARGNPDYTSIINDRHYERIARYVAEARPPAPASSRSIQRTRPCRRRAQNAAHAAHRPGGDLAVMRDEIFGPVLPIESYRGLDDAIAYVNARPR